MVNLSRGAAQAPEVDRIFRSGWAPAPRGSDGTPLGERLRRSVSSLARIVGGVPFMIWGYSVTPEGARRLVATLLVEGTPAALTAAGQISRVLEDDGGLVGLDEDERDTVLAVLEDDGGDPQLAEPRAALMRDFQRRHHVG
jgi:hypothetical protein